MVFIKIHFVLIITAKRSPSKRYKTMRTSALGNMSRRDSVEAILNIILTYVLKIQERGLL